MRHRALLAVAVIFVALFSAIALSQGYGRENSVQNSSGRIRQSSSTAAKAKTSFPRPNWLVKYVSGSLGLKSDQWLRIGVVPRLASAQIANPLVSVPADRLVAVEFNSKTEKESDLLQGPRSGCSYAQGMMPEPSKSRPEVLVAIALSPGPVSRMAEKLRPKHAVRLVWNEAGVQESMIVKVNDCEYQSFIANIRWTLGARWQEMGHELTK